MDSKVVNKAIKSNIFPFLKEQGFTEFSGRNALRSSDQTVDIINLQSFNSYLAEGVGCTTYSFAINLYVYYKCYEKTPWFDGKVPSKPNEYIPFQQGIVTKTLNQAKLFHPYGKKNGKDRTEIWYVKEDGSNLNEVIEDAKNCIDKQAIPLFKDATNLTNVIKEFEKDSKKRGMSWHNADVISTLALELGDIKKAISACEAAMKTYSESYKKVLEFRKKYKNKFDDQDPYEMAEERIKILTMIKK